MVTVETLTSRADVNLDTVQIDQLRLRSSGLVRWTDPVTYAIAPVYELANLIANRRSIYGRRMVPSFRFRPEAGRPLRLILDEHTRDGLRWSFNAELRLSEPSARTPLSFGFTLEINLNPTRNIAALANVSTQGSTARQRLQIPALETTEWRASNTLPDHLVLQPVAQFAWLDRAKVIAQETFDFVVSQIFGQAESGPTSIGWTYDIASPSVSSAECFWEFASDNANERVHALAKAFSGGSASHGSRTWSVIHRGNDIEFSPVSHRHDTSELVKSVVYPRATNGRIRLEVRYLKRVSTACRYRKQITLSEKLDAIAVNATSKAGAVLNVLRPWIRQPAPYSASSRHGLLASLVVEVLGNRPRRVGDVIRALLEHGGVIAGEGHLITINEARRLVRRQVIASRRMGRSRNGRVFTIGSYFMPLCLPNTRAE